MLEKLYVNVDVCNTMVIPEGNLLELLRASLNRNVESLSENDINYLTKRLNGYKFYTTYGTRKMTINRISYESAENLKFEQNGKRISVSDYFREAGTPLKHPKLPCVEVLKKKGYGVAYFPIEICILKFGKLFFFYWSYHRVEFVFYLFIYYVNSS